jgi:5'-nucleotidase
MVVEFDATAPPGSRIVRMRLDDGSPILDHATYTLAVPDFLADGGGGYDMLPELPQERLEVSMLDAMIAYLRALPQPVVAPGDARAVRIRR